MLLLVQSGGEGGQVVGGGGGGDAEAVFVEQEAGVLFKESWFSVGDEEGVCGLSVEGEGGGGGAFRLEDFRVAGS